MNLHDRDIMKAAKEEGIAEGAQQKAIEAAEKALAIKLSPEQVSQISGLPLKKVLELKQNMPVEA